MREIVLATGFIGTPYLSEEYQISISVEYTLKKVVACENVAGEPDFSTYGHLTEVNNILAMEIEGHFNIILAEYGVKINNSSPIIYRG